MISSKFGTFAAPVPLRSTLAPYMVTQLKTLSLASIHIKQVPYITSHLRPSSLIPLLRLLP